MVGFAESYFVAFAISVGMSGAMAGLFATLPLFIGALFHLVTPWAITRTHSVKKWVVFFVFIQALSFLPLVYFAIFGIQNYLWLFVPVTVYWAAGFATHPTWFYWMGHILKNENTSVYFSVRGRIAQVGTFLGLILGGLILEHKIMPIAGAAYAMVFTLAGLARSASGYVLTQKDFFSEWKFLKIDNFLEHLKSFVANKEQKDFFKFLFFLMFAISISSPFVVPFFLKISLFSYEQLMLALGGLFIGKVIGLQVSTKFRKRFGLKTLFFVGVFGVSPLPALWYFSHEFFYSVALQMLSGFFWAFFEVALSMIFIEKISHEDKIFRLTIYNFLNATAIILGTAVGGYMLKSYSETLTGYQVVFVLGSFLRLSLVMLYFKRSQNALEF